MRKLREDMMIVEFYDKSGEKRFPGAIVWSSTELPLVISQNAVDESDHRKRIPVSSDVCGSVVGHFYLEATVWYGGFDPSSTIGTQGTWTQGTFNEKPDNQCHEAKIGYCVCGPKRNGRISIDGRTALGGVYSVERPLVYRMTYSS